MPTESYDEFLREQLKDPEYAAEYLTACLEESPEVFLLALREVSGIYGDAFELLDRDDVNQGSLASTEALLETLGFGLSVVVKEPKVA